MAVDRRRCQALARTRRRRLATGWSWGFGPRLRLGRKLPPASGHSLRCAKYRRTCDWSSTWLVRIFKEVLGDAMPAEFTSIALNHNTVARRHADCKNSNVSAMAVVGDFIDGRFFALWDQG